MNDYLPNSWAQILEEGIGDWGFYHEYWHRYTDKTWETRLYELLFKEYTAYRHEQIFSKIYLNQCPIPTDVHGIILSFLTRCPTLPNDYRRRRCAITFTKHKSMSYGLVILKTLGYDFSTFYSKDMSRFPHLITICFETKQYEKARFLLKHGVKSGMDGYLRLKRDSRGYFNNNIDSPLILTIRNIHHKNSLFNCDTFFCS